MITSLILAAVLSPGSAPREKVHSSSISEVDWLVDERLATGGFSFVLPKGWSKHPLGKWTDLWLNKDGDITADIIRSAGSEQEIMNKYWRPQGGQFLTQEPVKSLTLGFNSVLSRRGTYTFGGKTWGMHLCVVKVGSQYVYGKLITSSMNSFEAESASLLELFGTIDEVNPKPRIKPTEPPKNPDKQQPNSNQNSVPTDMDFRTGDLLNEAAPIYVDASYVPKVNKPLALSGWTGKETVGTFVFEHSKKPSGSDYTLTIVPARRNDKSPLQIVYELWSNITNNGKKQVANSYTETKFGWTVLTETAEYSVGSKKFVAEVRVLTRNGYVMTSTGVTDGFYNLSDKSAQAHTILDRALSSDDPGTTSNNLLDDRIQQVSSIAIQIRTANNVEPLLSKAATLCGFTIVDAVGKVLAPPSFPSINCEISEGTLRSYARMYKSKSRVSKVNLYGAYDALTASIGFKINTKLIMSQALAFSMQSKNQSKRTFAQFISLLDMDHDANGSDYFDPAQALLISHAIQHDLALGETQAYLRSQVNREQGIQDIFASIDGPNSSNFSSLSTQLDPDSKEWFNFVIEEHLKKDLKSAFPTLKNPLKVYKYFKMLNKVADFVNILANFEHTFEQSPSPFPRYSGNGKPNDKGELRATFYINGSTFQNAVLGLQKSFPEIKFISVKQDHIPLSDIMTAWNILDRSGALGENKYLYLASDHPNKVLANPVATIPIKGKASEMFDAENAIPVIREVPISITGQAEKDGFNDIMAGAKPILKLIPNTEYITENESLYTDSTIGTPSVSSPGVAMVEGLIHLITEFLKRCHWEPFTGYETVLVLDKVKEPVIADISMEINDNFSASEPLYTYNKRIRRILSSQALPLKYNSSNEDQNIAMLRLKSAQTVEERKILERTPKPAESFLEFNSTNQGVVTHLINDLSTESGPDGDCAYQGTYSAFDSTKSLTSQVDLEVNKNERIGISVRIDLKTMIAQVFANDQVPVIHSYHRNTSDRRKAEVQLGPIEETRGNGSMFPFSFPKYMTSPLAFPVQLARSVNADGTTKIFGSNVCAFEIIMPNGKKKQGSLNINLVLRVPNSKK